MTDEREPSRRIDVPEPGFFSMRLRRKGVQVGARIVHHDGLWWAEIDGKQVGEPHADPAYADGVFRVWTSGRRISVEEHAYLLDLAAWARANAPDHPAANPRQPINLTATRSLF